MELFGLISVLVKETKYGSQQAKPKVEEAWASISHIVPVWCQENDLLSILWCTVMFTQGELLGLGEENIASVKRERSTDTVAVWKEIFRPAHVWMFYERRKKTKIPCCNMHFLLFFLSVTHQSKPQNTKHEVGGPEYNDAFDVSWESWFIQSECDRFSGNILGGKKQNKQKKVSHAYRILRFLMPEKSTLVILVMLFRFKSLQRERNAVRKRIRIEM